MLTLLKLFYLPRLKSYGTQLFFVMSAMMTSLYFDQYGVFMLTMVIFFAVIFYNMTNVNICDNIDWLKNSQYNSKQLFLYYLSEQSLMAMTTAFFLIIFTIITSLMIKAEKLVSTIESSPLNIGSDQAGQTTETLKKIMNSTYEYSITERSLETVSMIILSICVFFSLDLFKLYYTRIKFHKRFSLEEKIIQALIMIFFVYFSLKDIGASLMATNTKIILLPLFTSISVFLFIYVSNAAFKFFKPQFRSYLYSVPGFLFLTLLAFSLSFSKINFSAQTNLNQKIREMRFQWFFSPSLSKDELNIVWQQKLEDDNLMFALQKFSYDEQDLVKVIQNHQSLKELSIIGKNIDFKPLSKKTIDLYIVSLKGFEKSNKRYSHYIKKLLKTKKISQKTLCSHYFCEQSQDNFSEILSKNQAKRLPAKSDSK